MSTYVLNTIAFKKDLDNGVSQSRLVEKVKQLGFDAIEIRNEFLNGSKNERLAIAKEAQKLGLEVFYSVNDVLVTGDHLNNKALDYVTEMRELNSSHLKLNIGSLSDISKEELLKGLAAILDGQFEIAVENNQTLADSSLAITKKFFEIIQDAGIKDVHYCFDIANWIWLDTDVDQAADDLKQFTTYLHLKNAVRDQGELKTVPLEDGDLNWRALIKKFPFAHDFGLEYAGDAETIANELGLVKEATK